MNKKSNILLTVIVLFILNCCKKDTPTPVCTPQIYNIAAFFKQFQFKMGSYWVYDSPNSSQIDTMKVYTSQGGLWNYPFCDGNPHSNSNPNCHGTDNYCYQYEQYVVELGHRYFESPNFLMLNINYNEMYVGKAANYDSKIPKFLVTTAGDSISSYGYYNKLEKIIDTLTVNGTQYHTIYQMYYSPLSTSNRFQRIWWSPTIGMIKFEYWNYQNQVETWNVKNYHAVL